MNQEIKKSEFVGTSNKLALCFIYVFITKETIAK